MPVLDYNYERGEFFFTRPEGSLPFPGAAVTMTNGGRRFSFADVTPKSYYNLRMYKTFYKNEAKATPRAAMRVAAILNDYHVNYMEKYADLVTGTPYAHQAATINLMLKNDRYALLLEQGLGKTYIALQAFRMFKAKDGGLKAVVVCPKITYQTWLREIEKFAPEMEVLQYRGNVEERRIRFEACRDFDILLTTYEVIRSRARRSFEQWNGWAWQRLGRSSRETLVAAMQDKLGKCGALLADETVLQGQQLTKWRNACGKTLAAAADGYWTDRHYAYTKYEGIEAEWHAMNANVQYELRHDYPADFLSSLKPNTVVFDEASRLVNHTSQQSEAAMLIKAKRKYLMSGTLCVGRPTDMYMPMKVLDKTIIDMSWTAFRDKFCYVSRYNRHIITGYKNLDQLKRMVDPFIVAFTRDECLDLPDRTVVSCYYEPDKAVAKLYDEVVSSDTVEVDGQTVVCQMVLQKMQKCMQLLSGFVNTTNEYRACDSCEEDAFECVMGGVRPGGLGCAKKGMVEASGDSGVTVPVVQPKKNAKLEMLRSDLEEIVPAEKVIIWYWYVFDSVQIEGVLEAMDIKYIKATDDDCAARFESDPDCRVFLGQITQGIGITLNSATTTIYYSHGLALEPRLQSMDRNMRIGQSKPVIVRDYVCRGSIEESVVELLQHKQDVKDFMQKRVECMSCGRMHACLERGVKRYGNGCTHHGEMQKAAAKRTLCLGTLGGTYDD